MTIVSYDFILFYQEQLQSVVSNVSKPFLGFISKFLFEY